MFPANGADKVWAIQGNDSIEMMSSGGEYILRSVRPGYWQVSVQANKPYHNACYEAGDIKPGKDLDLGEIRLMR